MVSKKLVQKWADQLKVVEAARQEADKISREIFPQGAALKWFVSGNLATGAVIDNEYGSRIRVKNQDTGSIYNIRIWQILEAYSIQH